jgi:hypothetical protein
MKNQQIRAPLNGYYSRIKMPVGALTPSQSYMPFKAKKGDQTGSGFSYELDWTETNWQGEVDVEGFVLEGVAFGISFDTLAHKSNAFNAHEFLTKTVAVLKLDGGREIVLGWSYLYPGVFGMTTSYIPGASTALADHTHAGNGVGIPFHRLPEPIELPIGTKLWIEFRYNTNDVPTFIDTNLLVDARLICQGLKQVH